MIEMSQVRVPAGAAGELNVSSPGSALFVDSHFGIRSTRVLPQ